mgnify:FL=1|tara:strand:+ start:593 stop:970 length:378 start_codon:yes stop_codon:yes gene_type:complete
MSEENSQQKVDEITLEMFMNKKTFEKYKSQKIGESIAQDLDLETYKQDIQSIFQNLMDDSNFQVHPDVKEHFKHFCKSTIDYLQNKELFQTNTDIYENVNDSNVKTCVTSNIQSVWGDQIVKKSE